jgi:DnaJ-class molecular chaperone
MLFRRLGVDVQSLAAHEFTLAYFRLAKRYHPDQGDRNSHELMAHINAARTAILKAHRLRPRWELDASGGSLPGSFPA